MPPPNLRVWWPPPTFIVDFFPTSLVVFPSSCSRSTLLSPQLSLHSFPESFSLTRDLLSQPRATAKLSFLPMRPPPEPPPQNNQMAVTIVSPISNPKTMFQALSLVAAPPPSWLAPTRPQPEPPPISSTAVKSIVPPDPNLCCRPPKPPWLICCLIYFVLFDLCFSVCVFVCDFVFYVCCIVFWILYSCLVCIKCVCQLSFDVWYNIRCAILYEVVPDFISFAFYQVLLIWCDIVNKIKTNYSRNARDEVKNMISITE
ncbi:hypothetical protein MtrunA17_Chr7g0256921 [Medicago truncatula]|uniref:Transmembrane protein n=1 Tax=Medicago truncatula TaxID=3880 RepID=Q2HRF7_MEDTR|nr:hypothetical protein MtrDRAFT_AC158502g25v2 [Medicago truncatula]RHN47799.1 hypothetical protein MtrunA17_Chr7g0256921 [Medicago truncatula]